MTALGARGLVQIDRFHRMPRARNEQRVTHGAIGVVAFGRVNIAHVHVVHAQLQREQTRFFEHGAWRVRQVRQFEIRMKRGKVQRHFRAEIFEHPQTHVANFGEGIVQRGNNQVGDFEPGRAALLEQFQSFEHGLQVRETSFTIKILGEAFKIDVRRIHVIINFRQGLGRDVSRGDHHCFQAVLVRDLCDVNGILGPNGWIVIREGDALTIVREGELHGLLRQERFRALLIILGFGDVPILAEFAAQITARGADGKNLRAGKEVRERFLLDGIDVNGVRVGIRQRVEYALFILTDKTKTGLTLADLAIARAEITAHALRG